MTIITYRDGIMASDSCWSDSTDGMVFTNHSKLVRLRSGAIYGGAGDADDRALVELLQDVSDPLHLPSRGALIDLDSDLSTLIVFLDGRVFNIDTAPREKKDEVTGITPIHGNFIAVGSGRLAAMGAMAAGATAMQAASIACAFEIHCRPPVHAMRLDGK